MTRYARSLRWIALSLLTMLLLSGLCAGLFWPAVVAALTLPPRAQGGTGIPNLRNLSSPPTKVAQCRRATAASWATLAHDSFQRADQPFWGRAGDGQPWGADANSLNVFSIAGGSGQLANGQGAYDALLGPQAGDGEIVFTGSISRFNATSFGALLRWQDANNWYRASLDGAYLFITRNVAGVSTRLGVSPFAAEAGTLYTLRFRVQGTVLAVKAWAAGTPEPPSWLMILKDNSLHSGYSGLHFVVRKRVKVSITAFSERGKEHMERRSCRP
jgi:hypothetical protein